MATLNRLFSSPSQMEMKELNVCKLNFLVIKKLLNSRKSSFLFSGSHLPPIANSHEALENQDYSPQNKTRGMVPKIWRAMKATDYDIGEGVGSFYPSLEP